MTFRQIYSIFLVVLIVGFPISSQYACSKSMCGLSGCFRCAQGGCACLSKMKGRRNYWDDEGLVKERKKWKDMKRMIWND